MRLAVLIDAENMSADVVDRLFATVARKGNAIIRHAFGNFCEPTLKPWIAALSKHAISPCQQFSRATGKNAADIALVIGAMDILQKNQVDGFCIVSSDSDFTGLAMRLRESDKRVSGFGTRKAPACFVNACDEFVFLEAVSAKTFAKGAFSKPETATPLINAAATKGSWTPLSTVGQKIRKANPGFDPSQYGCKTLSDLVRKTQCFHIKTPQNSIMHIQPK